MKKINLISLLLVILALTSFDYARAAYEAKVGENLKLERDTHKVEFIAGDVDDGSYSILYNQSQIAGYTYATDSYIFYGSEKIYVTPKYRNDRLTEANKSTLKKLAKYQETIEKYKNKNNKLEKAIAKKDQEEKNLLVVQPFDSGEKLQILILSPAKVVEHSFTDYKKNLVCAPLSQKRFKLNDADRKYLKEVYSIKYFDQRKEIFVAEYDPNCFLKEDANQEKIIYKSKSYDSYFSHYYDNSFIKNKIPIKEDFNLTKL